MPRTLPIALDKNSPISAQLDEQLRNLIGRGELLVGTRLPSVRQLAAQLKISPFTVVTAYDRLVAANFIRSRRGAGYFVAEKQLDYKNDIPLAESQAMGPAWLLNALQEHRTALKAGTGLLPADWFDNEALKRAARVALRRAGASLSQYASAEGSRPLRDLLALKLIDLGISAQAEHVVLTSGASHALDLVLRTVLERGGAVVVEDPGYHALASYLKEEGIPVLTVPRGTDGIDLAALESVLAQGRAKLLVVNSVLQNPTGSTLAPLEAHRLVALAEKYQIHIVEDDVYGDFHKGPTFRIANLDQLNRVIYVSGFSKTMSADLRCGFIAAHKRIARAIAERKQLGGFLTSDLSERIVTEFLASGDYRRQIDRFREKLTVKRAKVIANLRALDLEVPLEPAGGFFVWARLRAGRSADKLAQAALGEGLVLAPGSVFSPERHPSSWLRFNVAHCDTAEFERRLRASLAHGE